MSSGVQTILVWIVDDCGGKTTPLEELHRFHSDLLDKTFAPLLVMQAACDMLQ
jgi:hypothetical protein